LSGLPAGFQRAHDAIVLVQPHVVARDGRGEEALIVLLQQLREKNFLRSACLVADGGVAAALVGGGAEKKLGCHAEMSGAEAESAEDAFFGVRAARALVTCLPMAHLALTNAIERSGMFAAAAIGRVTEDEVVLRWEGEEMFRCRLALIAG
jgi:phosphoribosylformylglycinamidine (FGAM) synthase-like enzyme